MTTPGAAQGGLMTTNKKPRRRKAHKPKPPVGPYAHLTPRIERDAEGKPMRLVFTMGPRTTGGDR